MMKKYKYLTPLDVESIQQTCADAAQKCGFPTNSKEYKRWVNCKLVSCEAIMRMHDKQLYMRIHPDWPKHLVPWTDELRHVKAQVFADIGARIRGEA